jgi:RluA family pseudouridine synthase
MEWTVGQKETGLKLVTFLKNKLGDSISARQLKTAIEKNQCRVNQRIEHFASTTLVAGDHISFSVEGLETKKQETFSFKESSIIYEDHELLIYNKPAGVSSDGPEMLESIKQNKPGFELLHRLDRDTTGLLMFTKGSLFREQMIAAFKQQKIEKVYLALVDGIPKQSKGVIDNYLKKIHSYKGQSLWGGTTSSHEGHHALTSWEVLKKGREVSLLRCYPKTGRTHQIRVHLSELGHPILGDTQYGKKVKSKYNARRCFLHAYELSFLHPQTLQRCDFKAPVPSDFQEAVTTLLGAVSL